MNKISTCRVAVISNSMVCDVCVFYTAVFGEMKLFSVLVFLLNFLESKFDLKLACKASLINANLWQTRAIEVNK